MVFSILKGVIPSVVGLFTKRQEAKQDARNKAAELLKAGFDERSNGWKDELALLVIVVPFIACFIPDLNEHIKHGFETLKTETPKWYQDLFMWGVGGALGITQVLKTLKR